MRVQGAIAERTRADSVEIFEPFLGLNEEEFKKLVSSVLIVIPHRPSEGINAGLFENNGKWAILGGSVATVADQFGGFVELTRNGIVRLFQKYMKDKPSVEYLVMIDNDEDVPWDAPYRLAQWGKDLVSGVVCNFSVKKGGIYACIVVPDKYGKGRFPSVTRTRAMPSAGLCEIQGCGTGLICIHRRVFEAIIDGGDDPFTIPEDIRKECMRTGTLKLSEDMAFSARVNELGFEQYVDFAVRAEHFKTVSIQWPDAAIDNSLDAKSWLSSIDDVHQEVSL